MAQSTILLGDCLQTLKEIPSNSIDAVVTDPPYGLSREPDMLEVLRHWLAEDMRRHVSMLLGDAAGLLAFPPDQYTHHGGGFMGKRWDSFVPGPAVWREVMRVLKPGGHVLAFFGTRTYDLGVLAMRIAGFEIRDQLAWMYSTGFPKSLNVSRELTNRAVKASECDVRFVRDTYVSTPVHACRECGQVLLASLPEHGAPTEGSATLGGEVRGEQPSVERRGDLPSWEGQLPRCEVCTMSHGVFSDGSQGLRHGASARDGDRDRAVLASYRGGPPHRSQPSEQRAGEPDAVFFQRGAQEVRGLGTALKPAIEPIVLARKPLSGTVARNVLAHGTGGINVDGCRIDSDEKLVRPAVQRFDNTAYGTGLGAGTQTEPAGRWPANVLLDEVTAAMLDEQTANLKGGTAVRRNGVSGGQTSIVRAKPEGTPDLGYGDSGGASRFFYVAKAGKKEREAGLDGLPLRSGGELTDREDGSDGLKSPRAGAGRGGGRRNHHPTVKPIALMRYLCRLITPPGGMVLDPFAGSGTTGIAAALESFSFIGCELSEEYVEIAKRRIEHWNARRVA